MSGASVAVAVAAGRRRGLTLGAGLLLALGVLVLVLLAGVALGARSIPPAEVLRALLAPVAGDTDHTVVRDLRVPRTLIGLAAGAALGLAGTLIQGVTRNPLADPGLLGLNAGAALAVVAAITWLGTTAAAQFVWFAFAGTAIAAVIVFGVAARGPAAASPVTLVLVGAAVTAAAMSLTTLIVLGDLETLDRYRFWMAGSLVVGDMSTLLALAPFMLVGALLAVTTARSLDAIALGDDMARGLGQRLGRARLVAAAAIVLLCGAATALAGPIAFVGLVVPHVARAITGSDHRWMLAYAAVLGAILLIAADVIGRLIAGPSEIEAGLVVTFLGAPVLIVLARRSRLAGL